MDTPLPPTIHLQQNILQTQLDESSNVSVTGLIDEKKPTPTTPSNHNYLSNKTVDPITALTALMHQSLQKNVARMAQLHSFTSPQPAQQPSPSYQYKPQHSPFPKWDVTPSTTPLFIAQILTYKAEAFYTGVHDWTRITLASRKLSTAISSDTLASLPSSI